jgi:hypothetical protein
MFCVNVELDDDVRINCTFDGTVLKSVSEREGD